MNTKEIQQAMRKEFIYKMAASALDGETSALEIYHVLKELKDAIDESLEQINEIAVDEVRKYKERSIDGVTYKVKNGAGRWDYSNVSQWNEQKKKIKSIEEAAKQASKHNGVVCDENGEIVNPATYTAGREIIYREKIK